MDLVAAEQLENALFSLLKEKEYKDISISELCNKAGSQGALFIEIIKIEPFQVLIILKRNNLARVSKRIISYL